MSDPLERLRAAAFTYPEVGATRTAAGPRGYRRLSRSAVLGAGPTRFEEAADDLLHWRMHRRAGLRVRSAQSRVAAGTDAILRLGFGPVGIEAPVRVVYVVDGPDRRGFAYGTLPGHPESGEESFIVELDESGVVTLRITAFSRPATLLARVGGPLGRAVQSRVTDRYLRAL